MRFHEYSGDPCGDAADAAYKTRANFSTPAQMIKEMLIASNNHAFNPLYDFLTQAYFNKRAHELGLVNWVVPENELQKKVDEIVAKVTAQSGPVLTMAKKAIIGSMGLPLREGVRNSMKVFLNELADLVDSQEGLRALVEKRAPKWKNR